MKEELNSIPSSTPLSTQKLMVFAICGGICIGLAGATAWLARSRYRTQRFYQACITGDDDLLTREGYVACPQKAPETDVNVFCDPKQKDVGDDLGHRDRCEYRRVGRRLRVTFLPGS